MDLRRPGRFGREAVFAGNGHEPAPRKGQAMVPDPVARATAPTTAVQDEDGGSVISAGRRNHVAAQVPLSAGAEDDAFFD